MKYVLLFFVSGLLISCSSVVEETAVPPKASLDGDSTLVKETGIQRMKGHFTIGHEAMAFIDCHNTDGLYWVIDKTGVLNKKIDEISGSDSYKTYVVELDGIEEHKVEENLQEGFSKTLTVSKVLDIKPRTHLTSCLSTEAWGEGDNGDWNLYISKEENVMEFYVKDEDISHQFFYHDPTKTNRGYNYMGEALGSMIKIVFEEGGCEGDSYGVIITFNDKTYVGCASKEENLSF